jgi:hypothetical protein
MPSRSKLTPGMGGIVRHEILRDVFVDNAPVTRLVFVDRLDVLPDQALVVVG